MDKVSFNILRSVCTTIKVSFNILRSVCTTIKVSFNINSVGKQS